jgi:hypothetical protein
MKEEETSPKQISLDREKRTIYQDIYTFFESRKKERLELSGAVEKINQIIDEIVLEEFGIENLPQILIENIHVLSDEGYAEFVGEHNMRTTCGVAFYNTGEIFIKESAVKSFNSLISVILHEALHMKAFHESDDDLKFVSRYGLMTTKGEGNSSEIDDIRFEALDEVITLKLQEELLPKVIDGADTSVEEKLLAPQKKILDYVCEEISAELNEEYPKPEDVLKEFVKAYFGGVDNREGGDSLGKLGIIIKQVFGEEAVELLANLTTDPKKSLACAGVLQRLMSASERK